MGRIVDLVEAGPPHRRNERARVVIDGELPDDAAFSFYDRAGERYIGLEGSSSEPHYFVSVPERATGNTRGGCTVGPEVTRHLRRASVFTITPRGGEGADILCRVAAFIDPQPGLFDPVRPPPTGGGPPQEEKIRDKTGENTDDTKPADGTGGGTVVDPPPGGGTGTSTEMPETTPKDRRPLALAWILGAIALIAVGAAAAALYAGPGLRGPLCASNPAFFACPTPIPTPADDAAALDAIASAGQSRPCEGLAELERWRARRPGTTLGARADALARTLTTACDARRATEAFAQATDCARARPCDTTCFGDYRRRFPGQRTGEISRRESEAARRCEATRPVPTPTPTPTPAPTPTPTPTPAPDPIRSNAWLRCETLIAPRWDPAGGNRGRDDQPRRPEAREALGVCATAVGEASPAERSMILFRLGRAQQIAGDRDTARQTLTDALRQGSKAAAHALGNLYYNSQPRQHALAAENYRIGAQAGIAVSKAALAGLLAAGEGVPLNVAEASSLAREAADAGVGAGARVYGQLVQDGKLAGGRTEACRWFRRAVTLGDPAAAPLVESTCP